MKRGLSIIIPAFNEERYLPRTLAAVTEACENLQNQIGVPSEIIVVDNGSDDATIEVAKNWGARVVSEAERNIAMVRNTGVRAAQFSFVATVDADTFVPADSFIQVWTALQTGRTFGGGVRTDVRTRNPLLRLSYAMINAAILRREGVSLGMLFCDRKIYLELGGFPADRLVGEDLAFARKLRDYSKTHGKAYCNLQSVRIQTEARKTVSFYEVLLAYGSSIRVEMGHKVSRDALKYWYDPDR